MVVSVYHRIEAALRADADRLDREYITRWFMSFASNTLLSIDHPRTGPIHIGGVAFCGYMADRYDEFTTTIIDDLLESYLRVCEDSLETVPDVKLDAAVLEFAGLLFSVASRLSDRQQKLRRRLIKNPDSIRRQLFHYDMPKMERRLSSRVEELRALRADNPSIAAINNVSIETNNGAVQVGTIASSQAMKSLQDPVRSPGSECP
jgi:hypothetical protein